MNPFGFSVQSAIPLPGYTEPSGTPDVLIDFGAVPTGLPDAGMVLACAQARPGQFLLVLDGIARYLVEGGNRITIQPATGVAEDEIRLFLMGSVWGALLLQRGLLPLHASAVRVGERAVAIAGITGNGKSTLAFALMERGYALVADELCALTVREGQPPLLWPGFPQVLLWEDALRKLGKDSRSLRPARPGLEKYVFPVPALDTPDPLPLDRLYVQAAVEDPISPRIDALPGIKKIHALLDCTYRVHYVAGLDLSRDHFRQCSLAARFLHIGRLERTRSLPKLESLARVLEEDFS